MDKIARSLPQTLGPRATTGLAVFTGYLLLIRSLRYLRRNRKHAQYPYKTREDFSKMTGEHAWEIVRYCLSLEFPFISIKSLNFALFRTYGIPSISKLLCQTQQLSNEEFASRRYADTNILITEFLSHSPTSLRANSAIARMNYLHGRYQKVGKISNDDMMFTLALFVVEVEKWIRLYEWRSLTPMEICAFGTHWKAIGDVMGIQWDDLTHGPNDFKDGLEFFEDIKEWSEAYEKSYMVPDKWNHQLAEETAKILMINAPSSFHPYAKQVIIAMMDDRLRKAMIYDPPPPIYPRAISFIIELRKLVLRHLFPPRPYYLRFTSIAETPDPVTGRIYTTQYEGEPWYTKPTFMERYSLLSWYRWMLGLPFPDGKRFKPEGFSHFEVGPEKLEGHGVRECEETRDRLMASKRGGCPFEFK
ncbi:hypothetical protein K458DRAFT_438974 [Lentithecium fluviatile CBS 122367]|uniref:ER-bound oxygenase mpaB/mpaB'/Rubber oxygenase catalytic domain-containing protein n=1 Tax=Lentithecium fluviatile CBS 122367 TaxID=1168545 RepID=A0A6G1JLN9_9PLEO|nr:hypothetical protein K458DRAFT_438974 [Lentithecium fluviatile CBS 122367]